METKLCTKCDERKPVAEFYRKSPSEGARGFRQPCRACHALRDQRRNSYRFRLKAFGLDEPAFLSLLEQQGGGCAICGTPHQGFDAPGYRLGVDHDHRTGTVRGLLCNRCNRALGMLGDDADLFRRAWEYLSGHLRRD